MNDKDKADSQHGFITMSGNADRDPLTRNNRYPSLEFLRLAIPRRVYTNNHMDYAAAELINVFNRKNDIKSGYRILYEAPIMRHFTVELEKI